MALAHDPLMYALPWLQGFFLATTVSGNEPRVEADFAVDVAGDEVIDASFDEGITVRDRDGQVVTHMPGFKPSGGSEDEIGAFAVGDAQIGTPVLALAATTGGHNENITSLTLFRISDDNIIEPIFTGAVEDHAGHTTKTGVVTIVPGGLIYQDLDGRTSFWIYDDSRGRYVERDSDRPSA